MSEQVGGREVPPGKDLAPVPAPATFPAPLLDLVLDTLPSPHSRRAYHRALGEFFSWYPSNASGEGFTRATVQRYRSHLAERELSAASINLHLAALRKLAAEASANSLIDPGAASAIASVPGARSSGTRSGNWLTLEQARRLLAVPDPATLKGLRDRVLLGFLVGCGLRRGELAGLEFSDVAQREGRWAIVDLLGKHGRVRTVPMPSWVFAALEEWATAAGITSGPCCGPSPKAASSAPGRSRLRPSSRPSPAMPAWPGSARSRRMIYAGHLPSSPTSAGRRSSRSRLAWGMPPSRPPSATWASSRTCTMRLVIGWGWWAGKSGRRNKRAGKGSPEERNQRVSCWSLPR